MKRGLILLPLLCSLASCGRPVGSDIYSFLDNYRIPHYLALAQRLQRLEEPQREAALRELSSDRTKASQVFPLCRMLFEAKPGAEFRRPLIGEGSFVGKTDYSDWPLEPIALYKGLPILIVKGYCLEGIPEGPAGYLDYCLKLCTWRKENFESVPREAHRQIAIVMEFLDSNPKLAGEARWFQAQAE